MTTEDKTNKRLILPRRVWTVSAYGEGQRDTGHSEVRPAEESGSEAKVYSVSQVWVTSLSETCKTKYWDSYLYYWSF